MRKIEWKKTRGRCLKNSAENPKAEAEKSAAAFLIFRNP